MIELNNWLPSLFINPLWKYNYFTGNFERLGFMSQHFNYVLLSVHPRPVWLSKLMGGFIGFLSGRRRRATEVRCALDKRKSWQSSLPALRTFLPCCHPVALSFPTYSFYSMELWVSCPGILRQNSNIRFQFQIYCCQLNYGTSQADMFFQHMLNQTSPILTSLFFWVERYSGCSRLSIYILTL